MKQFLGYGLLGFGAYCLFLVSQFPAPALVDLTARHLSAFSARSAAGSLIQGSAQDIRLHQAQLDTLHWQLLAMPFFKARIGYRFIIMDPPETQLEGDISVGLTRGVRVDNLDGQMTLATAFSLANHPDPLAEGTLRLTLNRLQLGNDGYPRTGEGEIRLLGVQTHFGEPLELGDFRAKVDTQGSNIVVSIADDESPLALDTTLTLTSTNRYRLTGRAAVRDNNPELRQVLTVVLGRPGNNDQWTIDLSGQL